MVWSPKFTSNDRRFRFVYF